MSIVDQKHFFTKLSKTSMQILIDIYWIAIRGEIDDNIFMHTTHQKKALCPLFVIKTLYWEFGVYAFLRVELKSKEKSETVFQWFQNLAKKLFYKMFKIVGNLENKTFCSIDGLCGPKISCHFDYPVAF